MTDTNVIDITEELQKRILLNELYRIYGFIPEQE